MADVTAILASHRAKQISTVVERPTPIDLDVALLAAFDPNPIPPSSGPTTSASRESALLSNARDGVQFLVNALFSLPTTTSAGAVLASLPPSGPTTALPRAKPLPKSKPLTKWQTFAKAKGIAPKQKKDRMEWDNARQEWVPRWGYGAKNKQDEGAWIREVKPGEDQEEGGLGRVAGKRSRKERILKNEKQRLENLERAAAAAAASSVPKSSTSALPTASTSTSLPSKANLRAAKIAANAANTSTEASARRQAQSARKREIEGLLQTTKKSTASMGKFDRGFEGEPRVQGVKRKFGPSEQPALVERASHLSVVQALSKDPSAFAEKHVKKGKIARLSASGGEGKGKGGELVNARKAIRAVSGGRGTGAMGLEGVAKGEKGRKR